jgi:hypothetical protein
MISITIPLKTVSEANCRKHWRVKARRHKLQKQAVYLSCFQIVPALLPCIVKITRIGRKLDDDNLVAALKYIRDAIAELLVPGKAVGRADDHKDIQWEYAQEKGAVGIRIEVY